MGEEKKSGIRLRGIDEPMRARTEWSEDGTLWFKAPVTRAESEPALRQLEALVGRLVKSAEQNINGAALLNLAALSIPEEKAGEPWTLRKAIVRAMFSIKYPAQEPDKKEGRVVPETPEAIGAMRRIGDACICAPMKPGVALKLLDGDIGLIRRKARELGATEPGIGLHPAVLALLEKALDAAEGKEYSPAWEVEEAEQPEGSVGLQTVDSTSV